MLRSLCLVLLLFGAWVGGRAHAQSLESVLAPGPVIEAHVKWEHECSNCHVRMDRAAQDGRCLDCHKDTAQDLRSHRGLHGHMKPQACRSCHTEHKGRNAHIAEFDKLHFDHGTTGYALKGKHAPVECAKCHKPGSKYREAPLQCQSCHQGDDVHKGSLGPMCTDCHVENDWKQTTFDHAKTRFALTGKHADVRCDDCHKTKANYKEAPRNCYGCHKKDDDSAKGHKGQYGERCDTCHGTRAWKPATFNHDSDTHFVLRGKHRSTRCDACHTGPLYKQALKQDCNSCHRKDDKHKGSLGPDCAACHTESDWKEKARFDHAKTDFPLLGKHVEIACDACHKSTMFKEAPKTCIGCHQKDDKHAGTLGDRCQACHGERRWKDTAGRFDHDRTRFKLRNAHADPKVACSACHADLKHYRNTAGECVACHLKDDKHAGQEGRDCAQCHDDKSWRVSAFNHARTRFPLLGRHLTVTCKDCHATPRFKDAPKACIGCHLRDDRHKRVFGENCASCHNVRAWSIWDFDHDRRSRFKLDGAHKALGCEACHKRPAPSGKDFAPLPPNCVACHRQDDQHGGGFGPICEQCHVTSNWKTVFKRTGQADLAPQPSFAGLLGEAARRPGGGA